MARAVTRVGGGCQVWVGVERWDRGPDPMFVRRRRGRECPAAGCHAPRLRRRDDFLQHNVLYVALLMFANHRRALGAL